jgi:hypothetical protein
MNPHIITSCALIAAFLPFGAYIKAAPFSHSTTRRDAEALARASRHQVFRAEILFGASIRTHRFSPPIKCSRFIEERG